MKPHAYIFIAVLVVALMCGCVDSPPPKPEGVEIVDLDYDGFTIKNVRTTDANVSYDLQRYQKTVLVGEVHVNATSLVFTHIEIHVDELINLYVYEGDVEIDSKQYGTDMEMISFIMIFAIGIGLALLLMYKTG